MSETADSHHADQLVLAEIKANNSFLVKNGPFTAHADEWRKLDTLIAAIVLPPSGSQLSSHGNVSPPPGSTRFLCTVGKEKKKRDILHLLLEQLRLVHVEACEPQD